MTEKLAAGLIVYRRSPNKIEYLLLQTSYGENHWTPPKGHLDEGENYLTAAIRETEEEAGLFEDKHYKIVDRNISIEAKYLANGKPKRVIYWLAELLDSNTEIKLSEEHINYKWLDLNESVGIVKYETMIEVLRRAEAILTKDMN
jgi:bis(5'-nucleosidyl)-tetraphosphatase